MSANSLKIIALITMTIDHVGMMLFPDYIWMRIIGRIAFPVFAFMIAEGCRYTHNRLRYLLQIALMGIAMQIVSFIATGSLYQSVFISFTLAILLIYAIEYAMENTHKTHRKTAWLGVVFLAAVIKFLCLILPDILYQTDYDIDYNIVGILLPVVCYFAKNRKYRILVFSAGLIMLSMFYGGIQWFCLLAIPLIGMYNSKKGTLPLKNLFYIYYPVHLGVIFAIEAVVH